MYLLLSFLFLPFAVLGTPVSPGLPAASPTLLAPPTSPEGNSSISGYVNNTTTVNGTPIGEDYCPAASGPHIIAIDLGFAPFTVSLELHILGMSKAVTYRFLGDRVL